MSKISYSGKLINVHFGQTKSVFREVSIEIPV